MEEKGGPRHGIADKVAIWTSVLQLPPPDDLGKAAEGGQSTRAHVGEPHAASGSLVLATVAREWNMHISVSPSL